MLRNTIVLPSWVDLTSLYPRFCLSLYLYLSPGLPISWSLCLPSVYPAYVVHILGNLMLSGMFTQPAKLQKVGCTDTSFTWSRVLAFIFNMLPPSIVRSTGIDGYIIAQQNQLWILVKPYGGYVECTLQTHKFHIRFHRDVHTCRLHYFICYERVLVSCLKLYNCIIWHTQFGMDHYM